MKTISEDYARELIDFAPTERAQRMGFAESQLHGAVAAFNMLMQNRVAYVADEVGMGKTYVALGVMGLLRFQNPQARIAVITPRENIQLKWIKELRNFVRNNWKCEDNRVKNLQGQPAREPVPCGSIDELARVLQVSDNIDVFLRSTTFSVAVRKQEGRRRCRTRLRPYVPWIDSRLLNSRDPSRFRDLYGRVLNAIVPDIDLLIVDEAHNFKHGFSESVSNRNRVLGLALGHPRGEHPDCDWYGPRVKRVLLLSATPFEYDYSDLYRQLDEFGFGGIQLRDSEGNDPLNVADLCEADEMTCRDIVRRFLIRRVQYLKIAGRRHSKNMYRREWRLGGYEQHDQPMELNDPKQRLVVGLIQKKVSEILGDRRFNNSFQIGMLSSFESFVETISRTNKKASNSNGSEEDNGEAVFDGDQDATRTEKRGVDSHSIERVVASYREQFDQGLPHPKLDATAKHLADAFENGEKALVFVRRIATVTELKSKLDHYFDQWVEQHMRNMLPDLAKDIDAIFREYNRDKRGQTDPSGDALSADEVETVEDELAFDLEDDEGGIDSFFAWFFRGDGPKNLLSGAAFQKNRLASVSSAYATFFEDDYVAWLLGRPADVFAALCDAVGGDSDSLRTKLRRIAYSYYRERTAQKEGYPKLYVFEAYQVAALRLLDSSSSAVSPQAGVILREAYQGGIEPDVEPPKGFPEPSDALGTKTFFTELVKRDSLREKLWPKCESGTFVEQFREREQRRELLSAMARLGAAYIDLYLLAIRQLGSFELRSAARIHNSEEALVDDYLKLLDSQMHLIHETPTFNAYYELSAVADSFDTLLAVNFPEVQDARISEFATIFGRVLQHQEPVGRMFGGVNKRLVKQFRMPGYPLVLATTDVLQEGEDLHTFCRRVIHYGITWTPSAMEQRTGRVDRIGSLVQRQLDGSESEPPPEGLIQVFYPHLADTVERLQVRRVLQRLNEFLRLIHKSAHASAAHDSRLDVVREILQSSGDVPKLDGLLESDFPVERSWRDGIMSVQDILRPDLDTLDSHFNSMCGTLVTRLGIDRLTSYAERTFVGRVAIANYKLIPWELRREHPHYREQPFELLMKSQSVGDATLIRCVSPIGSLDLRDDETVDELYRLQQDLGMIRICTRFDRKRHLYDTSVETDRLFHIDTTQDEELEDMVVKTVVAADRVEESILNLDRRAEEWIATSQAEQGDE